MYRYRQGTGTDRLHRGINRMHPDTDTGCRQGAHGYRPGFYRYRQAACGYRRWAYRVHTGTELQTGYIQILCITADIQVHRVYIWVQTGLTGTDTMHKKTYRHRQGAYGYRHGTYRYKQHAYGYRQVQD